MKKKLLVAGLAAVAALSVSAQQNVVKEVERALKASNPDYEQVLKDIQPALSNPETAGLAETWVLAGKAGTEYYQDAMIAQATGRPYGVAKDAAAAAALLDGFNYYLRALPLDSVVDAKGKTKTKFSKDIVKRINDRYDQLRNAGVMAWQNQSYQNAYDIWEMYLTLPTNPVLGSNAPKAAVDTIQGEIMWNQAIAMLLLGNNEAGLKKFRQMDGYGYFPADYYSYAMSAAQQIGDEDAANEFARKGLAQPGGASNSGFLAQLINTELDKKNFAAAYDLVNQALANTPAENGELRAQLYDIIGTIYENDNKLDEAAKSFKQSIEANPQYAKGHFDYGRMLYNQALVLDENMSDAERVQKVDPQFKEAATYFEKAYELDEELSQIPNILYRLYYRLGAGFEDKASYWQNM